MKILILFIGLAFATMDLNEYQWVILKHYLESRVEQHLITQQDADFMYKSHPEEAYHCMKQGCDIKELVNQYTKTGL